MDAQNEPLIDESKEPADEELKEQALEDVAGGTFHHPPGGGS
jgi:hypothetical protein